MKQLKRLSSSKAPTGYPQNGRSNTAAAAVEATNTEACLASDAGPGTAAKSFRLPWMAKSSTKIEPPAGVNTKRKAVDGNQLEKTSSRGRFNQLLAEAATGTFCHLCWT